MRKPFFLIAMILGLAGGFFGSPCNARHAAPPAPEAKTVKAILAQAPPASTERVLNVVLVAGPKDHGPGEHDYPLWQKRWKVLLGGAGDGDEPVLNTDGPPRPVDRKDLSGAENVRVATAWEWPSDEQWKTADLVVVFSAPPWNDQRLAQLETYLGRGGGLVAIHMAVWHPSPKLLSLIGTAYRDGAAYRHGPMSLRIADPEHPICLGLPREIKLVDESYFALAADLAKAGVVGTSRETRPGESAPRDEPMFWSLPRAGGRVFVCIPGHYLWTFDDPLFRILLLRGMAWAAGESPYRFDPLVLRGARVARPVEPESPRADDPELLLWLDATDKTSMVIDDDGHVSQWRNKARPKGRAVTAGGARRPQWIADALGNRPAVRFDGRDDVMSDSEFAGSADQWTLFLVATPRSNRGSGIPDGFHGLFSANAPGKQDFTSGLNVGMGPAETVAFTCLNVEGSKGGGVCNLLDQSSEFGKPRVLAIATDNRSTMLYAESVIQGGRAAGDAATSFAQIRIGSRFYFNGRETGFADADVAEVILYQRRLDEDRIAAVSAYLQNKYGVRSETIALTLDDALAALASYDWGKSRRVLEPIDEAIRRADAGATAQLETQLAARLAEGLPPAGSDFVCRRLAQIGTARSVPALASLLSDKDRAATARWALARIPDDAAGAALLASLSSTSGPARIEVIRALGLRCYRPATAALLKLLSGENRQDADAALAALAEWGEPQAVEPALARDDAPVDSLLTLAERLGADGRREPAGRIYDRLAASPLPQVRAAVLRGLVLLEPDRAAERLSAVLAGDDARLRGQAVSLVAHACDEACAAAMVERFSVLPATAQRLLLAAPWTRYPELNRQCALRGLTSGNLNVCREAIRLMRYVGTAKDVGWLATIAGDASDGVAVDAKTAEAAALTLKYLAADGTNRAIIELLGKSYGDQRIAIITATRERQMTESVPALLTLAQSADGKARVASLVALQTLGDSSTVATLVPRLLAAESPEERAAAERAVWLCARRAKDPRQRAEPLLRAIEGATDEDRAVLLPVLGRLGGPRALEIVHQARKSPSAAERDAAARALSNWPDAAVADELLELAREGEKDAQRIAALRGYIRVVTLRGARPDHDTLTMLRPAMELAARVEEKRLILSRLSAIVVPESLELALSYLDQAEVQPEAIAASTRLAELLLPNHSEAAKAAMKKILNVTTDRKLRDRLERQLKK